MIINDYVEVASAVGANGVHLGVGDEHPSTARKLLGESAIIGATINTRSDIERLQGCRIDYVGIGPFRFTSTKEQLAPILGLDGISEYCSEVRELLPGTLCIAVGGVQFEDLNSLIKTGIHGVAVATAINTANDPVRMTTKFLTALGKV